MLNKAIDPISILNKIRSSMKLILIFFLIATILSCSTLVTIDSEPQGAEVYINQKYMGKTPVEKRLSNFVGKDYDLRLEKVGYAPINTYLEKNVKAGILIVGIFLTWIPLLWVYGPEKHHYYRLREEEGESTNKAAVINTNTDMVVYVDGQKLKKGITKLNAGKHTFSFQHDGYFYQGETVSLEDGCLYRLK